MPHREYVFISDVHLGAFQPTEAKAIEQEFIALVEFCIAYELKLFILGDLFDYWMEYPKKQWVPNISPDVLEVLKRYNHQVEPIVYITGNHDNWDFGYFESLGFDVETDYRSLNLAGLQVLLIHGDGHYIDDQKPLKRPLFHRMLRSKAFIKLYQSLLPPEMGIGVMKHFSKASKVRDIHSATALNIHAEQVLNSTNFDYILSGHDHIPRMETFTGGRYINLGTFFHHRSLVLYNKDGFHLVSWKASTQEFVPFKESTTAE
jgi:UDP-2,3-diacylglucosamine pyrophosphatase LpxH